MKKKIRWGILIFVLFVLITAMVQNSTPVRLKLFVWEATLPTSILLLVTAALSFLAGGLTIGWQQRRRGRQQPQAEKPAAAKSAVDRA